jgi:deoxyribodipyrimidine photo-lyase
MKPLTLYWFRRDLRCHDNAGFFEALRQHENVQPLFIFDPNILTELPRNDARVTFIHRSLEAMNETFRRQGSSIRVMHEAPLQAFRRLLAEGPVTAVYTNHDYEPYAKERDETVRKLLTEAGVPMHTFRDQVIFEKDEVVKEDGTPYTVFTPFSKKWKAQLNEKRLASCPSETLLHRLHPSNHPFPTLQDLGFDASPIPFPPTEVSDTVLTHYHETRDIPGIAGTSKLSMHLRFGTVSVRALTRKARATNEKFLNELIWREFYQYILWHFPGNVQHAFKPAYDRIQWRSNMADFEAWCEGRTGYPIVDAGMRELKATGWMHNRVRMITASFLCKHLLLDWRLGEAWFARHLLDFDLASNNGGWQWCAGCGVDAAPYFRVFNPYLQTEKFDPELRYIREWVPELDTPSYPKPIVDHSMARQRCLDTYKVALDPNLILR